MKLFEISLVNDSQLYYTSVTLRCYLKEKKYNCGFKNLKPKIMSLKQITMKTPIL